MTEQLLGKLKPNLQHCKRKEWLFYLQADEKVRAGTGRTWLWQISSGKYFQGTSSDLQKTPGIQVPHVHRCRQHSYICCSSRNASVGFTTLVLGGSQLSLTTPVLRELTPSSGLHRHSHMWVAFTNTDIYTQIKNNLKEKANKQTNPKNQNAVVHT